MLNQHEKRQPTDARHIDMCRLDNQAKCFTVCYSSKISDGTSAGMLETRQIYFNEIIPLPCANNFPDYISH